MGASQTAWLLLSDGEAGTVSFSQQLRRAGLVKTVVTAWLLLLPPGSYWQRQLSRMALRTSACVT